MTDYDKKALIAVLDSLNNINNRYFISVIFLGDNKRTTLKQAKETFNLYKMLDLNINSDKD